MKAMVSCFKIRKCLWFLWEFPGSKQTKTEVKYAKQNIELQSEEKHSKGKKQVQQYFYGAVFHHVAD